MKLSIKIPSQIIKLHDEIEGSLKTNLTKAILIGELLVNAKSELKHGKFTIWINENLTFTGRTARSYMMLFERKHELRGASGIKEAYGILAGRTIDVVHRELREKVMDWINDIEGGNLQYFISKFNNNILLLIIELTELCNNNSHYKNDPALKHLNSLLKTETVSLFNRRK